MLRISLIAAALLSAAAMPTLAASMSAMTAERCDDASLMALKGKVDGMTNMAHKKAATSEMMMAQNSMKAHQMKSCVTHMGKATKDMGRAM